LRLKFWFQGGGGNNVWLDDININGTSMGIANATSSMGASVNVVPNPAADRAEIFANLQDAGHVSVDVLDLLGQQVMHVASGTRPAGPAQWAMDLGGLPSGLYLVRVQQQNAVQVVRFTKN
jgi:hypothetical protein